MDYSEEQKLSSKLLMIIFASASLIAFCGVGIAIFTGQQQGEDIMVMIPSMIFLMIALGFSWYMLFGTSFETQVGSNGITYRYYPLVRKYVTIPFSDIASWKYKTIKSIFDYGGYGYRKNVFSKRTAFIMGGKDVFEFTLGNGRIIAFTSANAYMLQTTLTKYMADKELK